MRHYCFSIIFLWLLTSGAKADTFCFASAETYYEQVYCQLQAKAQLKNLPPFHQFKKNNEQVQFSLLKRPAERNAIKLPAPVKKLSPALLPANLAPTLAPTSVRSSIGEPRVVSARNNLIESSPMNSSACELQGRHIRCVDTNYELLGNKANHRLAAGVLDAHNTMALPNVKGSSVALAASYEKYIDKMCEIGLCAVTMTYRKFAYLYQDLQTKGLDFAQRFETMFGFLKKDKAAMAVSESVSVPPALSITDCGTLGDRYFVCDHKGRNYVFALLK